MYLKNKKGFTLIELLVVVAIIGLLSSIVLVSLDSARAKARDAKRKSDIRQIQTALALYYNTNGYYPPCAGEPGVSGSSIWSYSADATWKNNSNCLALALKPFIPSLPVDPKNNVIRAFDSGNNYSYFYGATDNNLTTSPNPQDYDLGANLEVKTDKSTCQFKSWTFHWHDHIDKPGAVWCNSQYYNYSTSLYMDH